MRDHLREQDIERRLGLTAGEVLVDVAEDGTATVTMKRDYLDRIQWENHSACGEYDLDDIQDARAEGYLDGRSTVLKEIASLAKESAA